MKMGARNADQRRGLTVRDQKRFRREDGHSVGNRIGQALGGVIAQLTPAFLALRRVGVPLRGRLGQDVASVEVIALHARLGQAGDEPIRDRAADQQIESRSMGTASREKAGRFEAVSRKVSNESTYNGVGIFVGEIVKRSETGESQRFTLL